MEPNATNRELVLRITNKELVMEVVRSKRREHLTDELVTLLIRLTNNVIDNSRFANYAAYEDIKANALLQLLKSWNHINFRISSDVLSYYKTAVIGSCCNYVAKEKRQEDIKFDLCDTIDDAEHF